MRIIRDRATSVGKGFAYVQFKDSSSVPLALKLNGKLCLKRELRITRCKKDSIGASSSYEGTRANKNDKSLLDKKGRPMTGAQLRLATKAPRPPKIKSAKTKTGSKPGKKPGSNKAKKAKAQKKAETKVMKKVKSIAKKNKQAKKA